MGKNTRDLERASEQPKHRDGEQSFVRSPRRSAHKHAAALGISDRTVERILHEELCMHQYKMAAVQQLTERDFNARQTACESLEGVPPDALVFFSDKAHFHISGCVNKQNMRYWSGTTHENFMRILCIVNESLCGVFFRKWG